MKSTRLFQLVFVSRVLLVGLALSGAAVPRSYAASFAVNTTADTHDANVIRNQRLDRVCADVNGKCSLRAAIEEINASPDPSAIGRIYLNDSDYTLTEGQLEITRFLYLYGVESRSTIRHDPTSKPSRIFVISSPGTIPNVYMDRVIIKDGVSEDVGGGILIDKNCFLELSNSAVKNNKSPQHGAGICNFGFLLLVNSSVEDNQVTGDASGGGFTNTGGGISSFSLLRIFHSTISGNKALRGGGINNFGELIMDSSTISGNTAYAGGGGIRNGEFGNVKSSASATITFSTITNNTANTYPGRTTEPRPRTGGGIQNFGTVKMDNTIIAHNNHCLECGDPRVPMADYSPDCYSKPPAVFTSFRGNLVGFINNNCNLQDFEVDGTPFDQVGLDPGLVPFLTDNGGPTKTHALLRGSPAIDKAYSCRAESFGHYLVSTDQRSAIRPGGMTCDVGAYELGTPEPITTRLEISPVMGTYNRATKQFTQQVTLKNPITGSRITGQVFLVLDGLNLQLANKDGNSVNVDPKFPPSPYLIVNIGANNVFEPGETRSVTLIFDDPSAQRPQYTARVLAGAGVP